MTKQEIMNYFESFKGSELTYPFDQVTEVYKVGGKMFGLISEKKGLVNINLKGLPEDNAILRSMFDSIIPGYHMNKEHWITLIIDGSLERELIEKLITDSYEIVLKKLPIKFQKKNS